jgi:hypothetical protein
MQPWSTQYARSLSLDQWPDEIHTRFVADFANRIDSLPLRDPIKGALAKFGIEPPEFCQVDWDIYTIAIQGEKTSLTFSGWFFATIPSWYQGGYGETAPEPVWEDIDGDQTILLAFDGILHINNAGTLESEVGTIYTDPDLMPTLSIRGGEREDSIYSFHNWD